MSYSSPEQIGKHGSYRLGRSHDFLYSYIYMHPNDQNDGSMGLKSLHVNTSIDPIELISMDLQSD